MTLTAKSSLLIGLGLLAGATIWLWTGYGVQVFITFAQAAASWCF